MTDTYNHKTRRQFYTHPIIRQWNDATREIDRRQKAMKRAAGIYTPGSKFYPMPEPDTHEANTRVTAYFNRIRTQEYNRLIAALTEEEQYHIYGM